MISDTDTSRASATSATRSAVRRRRKLRLLCRSENSMAVLQRATGKPLGSVFMFNIAAAKTFNGKRVGTHGFPHHLRNGGDFDFLDGIPENRRVCV